jgi:hypothetical protein
LAAEFDHLIPDVFLDQSDNQGPRTPQKKSKNSHPKSSPDGQPPLT